MGYIRDRYRYISISVPSAMGALFFFTAAGYIQGMVEPSAILTGPFLGGGATLAYWYFYELSKLGRNKKSIRTKDLQSVQELLKLQETSDIDVYYKRGMTSPIIKNKLEKFCEIGCHRQQIFYENQGTMLENKRGFSKLTANQIWAESVFTKRGFLSPEVKACKQMLSLTGTFHSWRQGFAGLSHYSESDVMIRTSDRRWKKFIENKPTSSNFLQLLKTSIN